MSDHERVGRTLGYAIVATLALLGGVFGSVLIVSIFGSADGAINACIGFAWGFCLAAGGIRLLLNYLRLKIESEV